MRLHQYVIDGARRDPDAVAVGSEQAVISYGALHRRADGVASRLLSAGLRPADRVVLLSDKSVDCVIAMQAVLRAGAAYVPVDASTPLPRVAAIIADCAPSIVLCEPRLLEGFTALLADGPTVVMTLAAAGDEHLGPATDLGVEPDDLAYILYTSGSTGVPKGVCISHRNAMSFVDWAVAELGATAQDRFSNHAPFGFDLSVLDLYGAFAAGARVELIPRILAYAPSELVGYLRSKKITIWYSVPSALILMISGGELLDDIAPPQLRAILFAGEPFPISFVRWLASWTSARLLNLYGPTETNVCTFHEVCPSDLTRDRPVPIGKACSGDTVELLAPDGSACAPGEEGEVVVSGPTVMLGYWGADRLTGSYPTGDRAVLRPDGALDYIGRRDDLVKLRGHRIELGDVEAALDAHPGIASSAVVVCGEGLRAALVAFIVPAPDAVPGLVTIKAHLASLLPTSMNIDALNLVAALPRSSNGKADRHVLRGMHQKRQRGAGEQVMAKPSPPRSVQAISVHLAQETSS